MATNTGDVSYPDTVGNSLKEVVTKGPVVENVKTEASRTAAEFRGLQNARVTPSTTTATGQHLTPYHSLLYSLLSWEQPRATAVSYVSLVAFIFAARYLPLLSWAFRFLYLALGFTAAIEIVGRVVLSKGLASSIRPRKYYTIPKDTIEAIQEDIEQIVDFFLLEFQRILFAENVVHTVAAFTAALSAYWLIRWVPFWGLSLIGITVAYFTPLIYISNKEIIDGQIDNVQNIISSQAHQLKDMAGEHTAHATGLMKQYVGEYSAKAQEIVGHRSAASPEMEKAPAVAEKTAPTVLQTEPIAPQPVMKAEDFPEAPKVEPVAESTVQEQAASEREPLLV